MAKKQRRPAVKCVMPQGARRLTLAQFTAALDRAEREFGLCPIADETDADLAEYEAIGSAFLKFG
ncbi:hypothetical protein [Mycobacterium numidiamassiliense]|uniref:hypothetical protein n=1 Tax=Mycobacterium numidiamassiliense TaxID=1841861 RepID=UPI00105446C1|nr:hypothetical protein [Mycobacterium numidiamassiliense]